ncbi:hypothetical protein CRG98_011476 [Punica granatum]|uniref:Uncharacterized protein n=1 Tax=Punica granatum TaxID=22663 RepID=A0A2I0KI31_PUNGR|nr:hypothetical protein CRG98_011476 [Punica granatum]
MGLLAADRLVGSDAGEDRKKGRERYETSADEMRREKREIPIPAVVEPLSGPGVYARECFPVGSTGRGPYVPGAGSIVTEMRIAPRGGPGLMSLARALSSTTRCSPSRSDMVVVLG